MRLALRIVVFIFIATLASSCRPKTEDVIAPDYSSWPMPYSKEVQVIHNGNRVELLAELYYRGDLEKNMEFVFLLYNESRGAWLMLYDREYGEVNSSDFFVTYCQIFENKDGKWVFVKDFEHVETPESQKEKMIFLLEKYQLDLR